MSTLTDSPKIPAAVEFVEDDAAIEASHNRHFMLFQAAPAWLISMLLHLAILVILGVLSFADPIKIVNVLSATSASDDGPEIEEFSIDPMDLDEAAQSEELTEPLVDLPESMDRVDPTPVTMPVEVASVPVSMMDLAAQMAPTGATLQSLTSMSSQSFDSRSVDMKRKLLREYGGNASSEAAVAKALKWIALHQVADGSWTFQHNRVCRGACDHPGEAKFERTVNAATAFALLPFLGAGQTHLQGDYRQVVQRGLQFLVKNGKQKNLAGMITLDFSEPGGSMYSHGLVSILLCEAYAMTGDPALAAPAQAALNYTFYAQSPSDGGWRYSPRPSVSDTSVTGWLFMALKSGYMGHLNIPPASVKGAISFLDKVQSNGGAMYGYDDRSTSLRPACTAIGLLCRMYSGWDRTHPGIQGGVKNLVKHGVDRKNMYYNYYAAQVLRHYGGPEWDAFNVELRDWLVSTQSDTAGATGSWYFPGSKHGTEGGRLAATSFATMILEVYYRHMPIYASSASEDDFPL